MRHSCRICSFIIAPNKMFVIVISFAAIGSHLIRFVRNNSISSKIVTLSKSICEGSPNIGGEHDKYLSYKYIRSDEIPTCSGNIKYIDNPIYANLPTTKYAFVHNGDIYVALSRNKIIEHHDHMIEPTALLTLISTLTCIMYLTFM
jgi:hypothetical protein